jgi:hypothetical protein
MKGTQDQMDCIARCKFHTPLPLPHLEPRREMDCIARCKFHTPLPNTEHGTRG